MLKRKKKLIVHVGPYVNDEEKDMQHRMWKRMRIERPQT
jgi:hypothetical protein